LLNKRFECIKVWTYSDNNAPSATNVFFLGNASIQKTKTQICKSWMSLYDNILIVLSIIMEQFKNTPKNTLNIQ